MTFKTVFDVGQQGYTTWWFPALGLIGVAFGIVLVIRPAIMQRLSHYSGPRTIAGDFFGLFFLIFALVWTAACFFFTFQQYKTAAWHLKTAQYTVVEGPVTDFVPNPYKDAESFVVNGHRFSYAQAIVTTGFRQTAADGGPIREGLYVRISYSGNLILRLEVAQ